MARLHSDARAPTWRQRFVRFTVVGVAGFGVDVSVLWLCLSLGFGIYDGRLLSYLAAATTTWWLNRRFTFADADRGLAAVQWSKFVAVNAAGGAVNYGVYAALVAMLPQVAAHPTLGVAVGSLAGLVINFAGSKRLVFTTRRRPQGRMPVRRERHSTI